MTDLITRLEGLDEWHDLIDEWAFNVRLECLGRKQEDATIAIGGAVLNLFDLDALLQKRLKGCFHSVFRKRRILQAISSVNGGMRSSLNSVETLR